MNNLIYYDQSPSGRHQKNYDHNVENQDCDLHSKFYKVVKFVGVLCAFTIVSLKLFILNRPYIESKLFSNKLVLTEWVEDGTSYFTYRWTKETVGEPYLIPFSVSVLVTLFTWVIIYLDSRTPGENPPSPFAKSKYRNRSSTFHMGYIMALLSGVATFGAMLFATS
ncbi:ADP-ribosylation factor-like protein 6-interacting protein 6 [Ctenocephalides felis]|uniref:ADP-ribosylation factor-like protein 6-interacting protein 6 n=1 Tax=Ctenocephalides felis TaxID=7515 RepID=UPI000E6E5ADE|nr:ADP-ribosylation factor-like protein 6-interacting protein 6 [Ctenocephalides felis]XP_026465524.1 ADP-ribosylation factor-like protein 6-interacting protein 6 [Ctenocephalides felis]